MLGIKLLYYNKRINTKRAKLTHACILRKRYSDFIFTVAVVVVALCLFLTKTFPGMMNDDDERMFC